MLKHNLAAANSRAIRLSIWMMIAGATSPLLWTPSDAQQAPTQPAAGKPAPSAPRIDPGPPIPRKVDRTKISGIGIPSVKPFTPGRTMAIDTEYAGPQVSVRVMEATSAEPGTSTCLQFSEFPSDAVMTVVSGRLVLTPENGTPVEYVAGDVAILPKGFSGKWEDFGVYRHVIVMANGDAPPKMASCTATKN